MEKDFKDQGARHQIAPGRPKEGTTLPRPLYWLKLIQFLPFFIIYLPSFKRSNLKDMRWFRSPPSTPSKFGEPTVYYFFLKCLAEHFRPIKYPKNCNFSNGYNRFLKEDPIWTLTLITYGLKAGIDLRFSLIILIYCVEFMFEIRKRGDCHLKLLSLGVRGPARDIPKRGL